jgi:hypothetical protein
MLRPDYLPEFRQLLAHLDGKRGGLLAA